MAKAAAKKAPAKKRGRPPKRAHNEDGTFKADDPKTAVNESIDVDPVVQAYNILMAIPMKSMGVQAALKILQREV